jgi:GT2 family glycosyltransferase
VRTDVFQAVGNPWFEYKSSIDFSKVVSEDVDFCTKARAKGYRVVVDTGLKLGHLTKTTLVV